MRLKLILIGIIFSVAASAQTDMNSADRTFMNDMNTSMKRMDKAMAEE